MRKVLHVGCGGEKLPPQLFDDFEEVRLDIDERHSPHIVASMTDLGDIGQYDAIYTCHALEHLSPFDVEKALSEFLRVLKTDGYALILVPDLEDVKPTNEVMYISEAGPITGLDMYYGCARMLVDRPYMAHRTGFVKETMLQALEQAGFRLAQSKRMEGWNLMGLGVK